MLSHSIFQVGSDTDVETCLLLNDVNPPVVHEVSTQQGFDGQDFPHFVRDKLTKVLVCTRKQKFQRGPLKGPLEIFGSSGRTRTCNLVVNPASGGTLPIEITQIPANPSFLNKSFQLDRLTSVYALLSPNELPRPFESLRRF